MSDMNVGTSPASDPNAAARAQQEAEARAAEEARRIAEEARRKAEEERRLAEEAQRRSEEAAAAAAKAKAEAEEAAKANDAAAAADAQKRAEEAQKNAEWAAVGALGQMQRALEAEKTANTKATEAALPNKPYPEADQVKDIWAVRGFDRDRQKRVLGTDAFQTPQLRAQDDAKRVYAANEAGAPQGAEMTRSLLEANPSPEYRAALIEASKGDLAKLSATAHSDNLSAEDKAKTLNSLEQTRALLPPEAQATFDEALRAGAPDRADVLGPNGSLRANTKAAFEKRVQDAQNKIHESSNNIHGEGDQGTAEEKAARQAATVQATKDMETAINSVPPEYRGDVLKGCQDDIKHITNNLVVLDKGQTQEAINYLGRSANAAGAQNAGLITDPIAEQIAAGKLQQTPERIEAPSVGVDTPFGHVEIGAPSIPDPTGGLEAGRQQIENRNVHNSEREFIDGIHGTRGTPEGDLFQASLTKSLHDRGVEGFAGAVAGADSTEVPDDNLLAQATNVDEKVKRKVNESVQWLEEKRAEAVRGAANFVLGIDTNIEHLNSTGDKWEVNGQFAAGAFFVQGDAEAKLTVEKTDDGYKVEANAAAGVGAFIGFGEGAANADLDANVLAGAKGEFKFGTAEEAKRATYIMATAGSVPPSEADVKFLKDHFEKATVEVKLQGRAQGSVGAQLGKGSPLSAGVGGEAKAEESVGLEIDKNGNKTVVMTTNVELEASASAGLEVPGQKRTNSKGKTTQDSFGVELQAGVSAKVDLKSEIRFPLTDADQEDITNAIKNQDPDAIKRLGERHLETSKIKTEGTVRYGANAGTVGTGVEMKFEVNSSYQDQVDFYRKALDGDVNAAFHELGDNVQVEAKIRKVNVSGGQIAPSFNVDVGKVAGQYKNQTFDYDSEPIYQFKGTANQFVEEGQKFIDTTRNVLSMAKDQAIAAAEQLAENPPQVSLPNPLSPFLPRIPIPIRG